MNKKRIFTIVLIGMMLAAMTGCSNNTDNNSSANTSSNTSSDTTSETSAPDDYVDNSVTSNPLDYTDSELYANIGDIANIATRDEQVYINNEGFQYRFTTNLLTTDKSGNESTNAGAVCISDIKDHVSKIVIGNKEYTYSDLIRDKTQGLEVVKMLSQDFGINIHDENGILTERKGNITDTAELRNAYSDREEFEDYTVCAYYFDARLNNLDSETYKEYREEYNKKYNTDTGAYLDGTLAVLLYYDTKGNDYFYSIVLSAPTYWNSKENFMANMNNNVRKDISKCYMEFDNELKIGFVNKMTIMCSEMPVSE